MKDVILKFNLKMAKREKDVQNQEKLPLNYEESIIIISLHEELITVKRS
jgi:hypothetical protein